MTRLDHALLIALVSHVAVGCAPRSPEDPSSLPSSGLQAVVGGTASQWGSKVEHFDRSIAGAKGKVRRCYQDSLDAGETRPGAIELRFKIRADGRVSDLATSPRDITPAVDACVRDVLQAVAFAGPENGGIGFVVAKFSFAVRAH